LRASNELALLKGSLLVWRLLQNIWYEIKFIQETSTCSRAIVVCWWLQFANVKNQRNIYYLSAKFSHVL